MPYGYHGCYLRIDVSTGRAERVPLGDALLRQYIGGSGLGTRLLIDEGGAVADPLSPEAPLVFAFSPLVGTPLTTSAKFAVVSRSPLTQRVNDSLAGSGFALAGKRCGSDALVIVGRASGLSLLVIDDGDVRLVSGDRREGASQARARFPDCVDRTGRRARRALRDHLARSAARGPRRLRRRARRQEHQGPGGSRHAAVRVGRSGRARRVEPRSVAAVLRPGYRQVS